MTRDLDLRGLACELHRSYDWTVRSWRALVALHGLPAPFLGGERHARPVWSGEAVAAWKAGRAAAPSTMAVAANDREHRYRSADDAQARLLGAAGG
jgi:hypothetical protein